MRSSEVQGVAAVFWDVPCGARASRGWAQPSSWRSRQCSARGGPGTLLVGTLCWGGGTQGHPESEREGTSDTRKCVSYLAGSSIFQRRVRRAHEDPEIPVCPWRGARGAGFDKHVTESRPGASGQGPALQVEMARACAVWPGSLSPRVGLKRLQCGWGGGGATFRIRFDFNPFYLKQPPGADRQSTGRGRRVQSPEPGRSASGTHSRVSPVPVEGTPQGRGFEVGRLPTVSPRQTGPAVDDQPAESDGEPGPVSSWATLPWAKV